VEVTRDQAEVPVEIEQHMVIQLAKVVVLKKVDQEVPVLPTSQVHMELRQEVEQQQAKVF
jgi:hypothetical protein